MIREYVRVINRNFLPFTILCFLVLTGGLGRSIAAQDSQSRDSQPQDSQPRENQEVVAMVSGSSITKSQLRRHLVETVGERPVGLTKEQDALLQARALDQLIGQLTVIEYLKSKGQSVTDAIIDLEIDRLTSRAKSVGKEFSQVLEESGMTKDSLRAQLRWQMSWTKFLEKNSTDENLQKVFESNRALLDGTKIRIAHLLIIPTDRESQSDWMSAKNNAQSILARIQSSEVDWADAVTEFSQAATKENAGDIGWVSQDGVMPKPLVDAAFATSLNGVSEPVRTVFGMHLVKVLEIEQGQLPWNEVGEPLKRMLARQLFDWVLEQHRDQVEIEFTGKAPYFDSEGELVIPNSR